MSIAKQRGNAWTGRLRTAVALGLLAIGFAAAGAGGPAGAAERADQVVVATAPPDPSELAAEQLARCATGEVAIALADVGVGDPLRCLPVGGAEVPGSRVDPLYSHVADDLLERIAGAADGANVKVICWSEEDSRAISVAFSDAGKMDSGRYWLGWAPRERRVVNLSSLACQHLDRIAYSDGELALPAVGAAVGTLAHETMHVAGIYDEGIADCYAMQLTSATAVALGAGIGYGDELQTMNFEFNRERRQGTKYDSPDCFDGGPLDLNPESSRWP